MVNSNPRGVSTIQELNPQVQAGRPLASAVVDLGGSAYDKAAAVLDHTADKIGAMADRVVKIEGEAAGKQAGLDPNYRPMGKTTLYGAEYERHANDTYYNQLQAKVSKQTTETYLQWASNPDAKPSDLNTALEGIKQKINKDDVFPDIQGRFSADFERIRLPLAVNAHEKYQKYQKQTALASAFEAHNANSTAAQQLLTLNPFDQNVEGVVYDLAAKDVNGIDAQIKSGALDPIKGAEIKQGIKNQYTQSYHLARAAQLQSPEAVEAYRTQVREKWAKGETPSLDKDGFEKLDTGLVRLQSQMKTQYSTAENELTRKLDSFVSRAQQGFTPSAAEWLDLQQGAQKLGGTAVQKLEEGRQKIMLGSKIWALPVEAGDALVRDLEGTLRTGGSLVDKIVGAESSGKATAKNPRSSATGAGQFIEETWLGMVAKYRPELLTQGKTKAEILALRNDPNLSREMTQNYAKENGTVLKNAGIPVNDATLYLAHFAGPRGAVSVLQNPTMDAAAAMSGGDEARAAKVREQNPFLRNYSAADLAAWATKKMGGAAGFSSSSAEVLGFAREQVEQQRQMIGKDMLGAAQRKGMIDGITPLDVQADTATLSSQIGARQSQVAAVAAQFKITSPAFFRPDEKASLEGVLRQGGDKALSLVMGILGEEGKNGALLREMGGDAPALGHAALVSQRTGDPTFARVVAQALKARAMPDAKAPSLDAAALQIEMQSLGGAFLALDASSRATIQHSASLYFEAEAARRNIDPKGSEATPLLKKAVRLAMGETTGQHTFGGVADYTPHAGWTLPFAGASAEKVIVPSYIRQDKFGDVLSAIEDQDLQSLPKPPMHPNGRVITARELRGFHPYSAGSEGYFFGKKDSVTARIDPIVTADGTPFILPLKDMVPVLRQRLPNAFR